MRPTKTVKHSRPTTKPVKPGPLHAPKHLHRPLKELGHKGRSWTAR